MLGSRGLLGSPGAPGRTSSRGACVAEGANPAEPAPWHRRAPHPVPTALAAHRAPWSSTGRGRQEGCWIWAARASGWVLAPSGVCRIHGASVRWDRASREMHWDEQTPRCCPAAGKPPGNPGQESGASCPARCARGGEGTGRTGWELGAARGVAGELQVSSPHRKRRLHAHGQRLN